MKDELIYCSQIVLVLSNIAFHIWKGLSTVKQLGLEGSKIEWRLATLGVYVMSRRYVQCNRRPIIVRVAFLGLAFGCVFTSRVGFRDTVTVIVRLGVRVNLTLTVRVHRAHGAVRGGGGVLGGRGGCWNYDNCERLLQGRHPNQSVDISVN